MPPGRAAASIGFHDGRPAPRAASDLRLAGAMRQLLRAAVALWNLRGAGGIVDILRRKLYWRQVSIRFVVDLQTWSIEPRSTPGMVVREVTLDELRGLRTPDHALAFYTDRTHGGRRCYVGFVDGEMASISWVFGAGDRVRHMRLRSGEIMLDGAFTLARFRGRGLLSAVERAILDDARREGMRVAYTHVAVDNRASLRGVAKTGFRPAGVLTRRWILGVPIRRYGRGARAAASVAGLTSHEVISPAEA